MDMTNTSDVDEKPPTDGASEYAGQLKPIEEFTSVVNVAIVKAMPSSGPDASVTAATVLVCNILAMSPSMDRLGS
jgi:hypothetical protein